MSEFPTETIGALLDSVVGSTLAYMVQSITAGIIIAREGRSDG